jgi:NAD(P)-dependent dehydrogenase (short-subunit alcohol dehydrogenase family)
VGDLAAALQKMAERAGAEPGTVPAGEQTTIEPEAAPRAGAKGEEPLTSRLPVQRFTWKAVPLALGAPSPVVLNKGARVVILSWNKPSSLAAGIGQWFSTQYRAKSEEVVLPVEALGALAPEAIESEIARRAPGLASAAGLLITTDGLAAAPTGASAVAPAMTAAFAAFKTLLASPDREFAVVVDPGVGGAASAISEGLLGLLLSASHEYSSAVFRHATVESGAALPDVLERCLDTSLPIVALRFRGGEVLTDEAGPDPLPVRPESRFRVGSGDVILVTGGARGITGRAAAALAPFGPRLILLGRTPLDPAADLGALLGAPGIDAEYWTCDVSRPAEVEAVVGRAVDRFGRVDGIVHGAGVLRDTLLDYMGVADFAAVAAVKVAGLAALLGAAEPHGLRYVVGFSSLAAVTGNAGQANYAASSRAMAGLVRAWAGQSEGRRGHTLWLPPVKDLGMAAGREIREALERRGLGDAYVGVDEVGTALAHEIVLAPAARTDAIMVRMHPPVRNVKFQAAVPAARPEGEPAQAPGFDPAAYPLIDRVETLDRERGLLVARRVFRAEHDLWLPDHQPIRGMTQPILSAIMLVETVLEAARILYPHLDVIEVGDVDFLEMLECRAGAELATDVVCRASRDARGRVVCDVAVVGVPDAAEPPRADHAFRSFGARITLGGGPWQASAGARWLAPEQCDTEAKDRAAIAGKYETKTGLHGRYRVLEGFDGTADGLTAGHMIYAEQADFAGRGENGYQFAPYLLESLLQVAHFYPHMRDETDERDALPMKIGRMHIGRRPALGEDVRLEGRRSAETEAGLVWELRAFSSSGEILLDLSDFLARWIAQ